MENRKSHLDPARGQASDISLQIRRWQRHCGKANEFRCNIWVELGNKKMNAKSLLGIMSMCIGAGASVVVSADGPDEGEAVATLCDMLQRDVL